MLTVMTLVNVFTAPCAAEVRGDYELFLDQSEKRPFDKQTLLIHRGIDLSPLFDVSEPVESALSLMLKRNGHFESLQIKKEEDQLDLLRQNILRELKVWPNIEPAAEKTQSKSIRRSEQRLYLLAQSFTESALDAYRQVDFVRAQASLDSAIELLNQLKQRRKSSHELGYLYLLSGVISVERDQLVNATLLFQRALLIEPSLRLKSGFDYIISEFKDVQFNLYTCSTYKNSSSNYTSII